MCPCHVSQLPMQIDFLHASLKSTAKFWHTVCEEFQCSAFLGTWTTAKSSVIPSCRAEPSGVGLLPDLI